MKLAISAWAELDWKVLVWPWDRTRCAVFGEELIIDGGAGNSYSKPVLVFHESADGRKVRTGVC
jgi:hypothetical protein